MHSYFRNHQLYLAEKCNWLDRHVEKTSKRALMKIESWKTTFLSDESDEQLRIVEKMVQDSLLTPISNRTILRKEGFYVSNLDN